MIHARQLAIAAAIALVAPIPSAVAGLATTASVSVTGMTGAAPIDTGTSFAHTDASYSGASESASASATARSGYGAMGAGASAAGSSSAGFGGLVGGNSSASASFTDSLMIYSSVLAGQRGRLIGSMTVEGHLFGNNVALLDGRASGAKSSFYAYVVAGGTGMAQVLPTDSGPCSSYGSPFCDQIQTTMLVSNDWYGGSSTSTSSNWATRFVDAFGNIDYTIPISLDFTFGTPFDVSYYLGVVASAGGSGGGTCWFDGSAGKTVCSTGLGQAMANADFFHTMIWDGISSVEDLLGNALPWDVLSISSESGFDYRYAAIRDSGGEVPEPDSGGLLLLSLVSLFAGRHAQRRTARSAGNI